MGRVSEDKPIDESKADKSLFFQQLMSVYGLYVEGKIGWEALVEQLLGLSEQYREQNPVTQIDREVGDKVGHWRDGGVRT